MQNKLIKICDEIDINPLLECYYKLEPNIHWVDYPTTRQAGLQYRDGNDPLTDAVGSSDPNVVLPGWNGKKWIDKNEINLLYKNTIFEETINQYNLFRTRLIWVKPYSCYSLHRDTSPRFHIPLVTNEECFFVFKDMPIYHMSVNKLYWADTTYYHTFINCSSQPRLHIVSVAAIPGSSNDTK